MDSATQSRFDLIASNLQEFLNPEIIEKILIEGRSPRVYWGTATTGRPHIGYFLPALKIAQLLKADCEVTVLLADIHGFLDNLKAPLELVDNRAIYYRNVVTALVQSVGVDTSKLNFVLGSSYQKSPEYVMDVYRMASMVSESAAKKAGAEVVKQTGNAPLSGLLYPILQVLDEQHLNADCQLGGAATEWLPKLGYRVRAHIMNPMMAGLGGQKMSSSDGADAKIDLLDDAAAVAKKIKKAECFPKIVEDNGVLSIVENILLPAAVLNGHGEFRVERREGEPLVYTSIAQVKEDYAQDILTPQILKPAVSAAMVSLMAPIQAAYETSAEWQEITLKAYPPPVVHKKVKKPKDRGTRFPGAKPEQEKASEEVPTEKLAETSI
ncbi:unnamed protein product [Penicillium salamii]|uniref:Tyrosine--tRNA ligase n=1 Tax=Penicillium salamii TaxID=1612424 RepID=A0A9W4J092_9EURO|nr:unnamed protein product [Penicillium salamii]CAG8038542.1 unnamed protein product [Penicillium salamii]CAG8053384.1 unnamed protein product [Penicillium salamii]CAG8204810.1 unnamed protein product [Penicillium salamii]CAG8324002.1 unnamed protein product [Penicillium salamii]